MNCLSLLFAVVAVGINVATATDHCSTSLCSGKINIACGNSGQWATACQGTGVMINMDATSKSILLNAHNKHRNFIAGGGYGEDLRACRMTTMEWDDKMANLAALDVKRCDVVHDACRNTDTFKYSGQNNGWGSFTGAPNHTSILENSVNAWYSEVKDSKQQYINAYPNGYTGPPIGNFIAMMTDKNIRTGCAGIIYTDDSGNHFMMTCNYATTNIINYPIYKSCPAAGTDCTTGRNAAYGNLCSTAESYDVNKWF